MANTFKFGNGNWAVKDGYALAYNDENNNFKPLPFDFTRASTATRVNRQGLVEVVPSGKPRIDFTDNTSGHLLLEPSRTNYVLYSETEGIIFGSNGWQGDSDTVITKNYGTAPYNGSNLVSTRLQFAGASKEFRNNFSSVTIQASASTWIKGTEGETIKFGSLGNDQLFTLTGDWQKLEKIDTTSRSCDRISFNTFSGATARDIEIYAPQVEAGSYATSYIPTEGSSVTRVTETCYQDDLRTDIIDSTYPFIIYAEAKAVFDSTQHFLTFGDRTSSARYFTLCLGSNGTVFLDARANGASENLVSSVTVSSGDFFKVAVQMESATTGKISVNGTINTKINFASQGANSSIKDLLIGMLRTVADTGRRIPVKDARLYDTALTDTELQNLTS